MYCENILILNSTLFSCVHLEDEMKQKRFEFIIDFFSGDNTGCQ